MGLKFTGEAPMVRIGDTPIKAGQVIEGRDGKLFLDGREIVLANPDEFMAAIGLRCDFIATAMIDDFEKE